MARWTAAKGNWTPTAVADTAAFTDNGYMALQGGSSTQKLTITEIYMGGLAAAGAPAQMVLARDSTVGATALSGVTNAAQDPATAALAAPPNAFSVSTTKPQRSSTLQLLDLSFNAFGGVIKWTVQKIDGLGLLGNTASLGELSLSSRSAGTPGLMGSHFIYEPD